MARPIRVSKRKYDKLFRQRFKGRVGVTFAESIEFDSQYKIVGFYPFRIKVVRAWRAFKGKISNLRGIKLGRIHYKNDVPYVKGADKRLPWDMDNFLATIMRDYLRMFEKQEYHIGGAVLDQDCAVSPNARAIDCGDQEDDELRRRWHDMLLQTADMFDQYVRDVNHLDRSVNYRQLVNDAFENTKKIFMDLWT